MFKNKNENVLISNDARFWYWCYTPRLLLPIRIGQLKRNELEESFVGWMLLVEIQNQAEKKTSSNRSQPSPTRSREAIRWLLTRWLVISRNLNQQHKHTHLNMR